MSASAVVGALLQAHSSVVFAKDWCGYCQRLCGLLKSINQPFHYVELEADEGIERIISSSFLYFEKRFFFPLFLTVCVRLVCLSCLFGAIVIVGDLRAPASDVQAHLRTLSGKSSVPQLFHKGKFVSDCDGSHALHRSGKLVDILKS
eukprot:m.98577 g.98577  ORF g.98577 m.98577 type:complete len:147 (+) comp51411_c0_seq1:62-502(+)